MRRNTIFMLFGAVALCAVAKDPMWLDPNVNAVNRAPMHTSYFAFETPQQAAADKKMSDNYLSLDELQLGRKCRPASDRFLEDGFR